MLPEIRVNEIASPMHRTDKAMLRMLSADATDVMVMRQRSGPNYAPSKLRETLKGGGYDAHATSVVKDGQTPLRSESKQKEGLCSFHGAVFSSQYSSSPL
jgi:hypothetical protein